MLLRFDLINLIRKFKPAIKSSGENGVKVFIKVCLRSTVSFFNRIQCSIKLKTYVTLLLPKISLSAVVCPTWLDEKTLNKFSKNSLIPFRLKSLLSYYVKSLLKRKPNYKETLHTYRACFLRKILSSCLALVKSLSYDSYRSVKSYSETFFVPTKSLSHDSYRSGKFLNHVNHVSLPKYNKSLHTLLAYTSSVAVNNLPCYSVNHVSLSNYNKSLHTLPAYPSSVAVTNLPCYSDRSLCPVSNFWDSSRRHLSFLPDRLPYVNPPFLKSLIKNLDKMRILCNCAILRLPNVAVLSLRARRLTYINTPIVKKFVKSSQKLLKHPFMIIRLLIITGRHLQ